MQAVLSCFSCPTPLAGWGFKVQKKSRSNCRTVTAALKIKMGGWVGKIEKEFSPLLPGVADGPGDPGGVRYLVGRGNWRTGGTPRRCGRTRKSWGTHRRGRTLTNQGFGWARGVKGNGNLAFSVGIGVSGGSDVDGVENSVVSRWFEIG